MSTIRDVAKIAGVSVGTVSNYFNGIQIKEANRKNIEIAVNQLNFRLNPMARGLKTNRSGTIGVLIQDLADIFQATYVKIIEKKLFESGYNIMICDTGRDEEVELKQVELLLSKRVDGLIIAPSSDAMPFMEKIIACHIPCVLIDAGTKLFECDQVLIDNDQAVYEATELLINRRHRRIGIITGTKDVFTARERMRGFSRAMENYHIEQSPELIKMVGWEESAGFTAMNDFLCMPNRPTAVIAANYKTTVGVIKSIYQHGIVIPQDLSLIGFDDIGFTELVKPRLSVVSQPLQELGKLVAEIIFRRLHGDYSDFPSILRLKTTLHDKESVSRLL
jgi:LacI family transcriptional regulator